MGEIWEEFEAIDQEVEKQQKKLIDGVDFYCAIYQANQETLKREKLKKYKMGAYFDKELAKKYGRC